MTKNASLFFALLLAGCSPSPEVQLARDESICKKSHTPGTKDYANCLNNLALLRETQPQGIGRMFVLGAPSIAGVRNSVR